MSYTGMPMLSRNPTAVGLFPGSVRVFLAEALLLPTGLITAGCLTRVLGPEGYGIFTLVATITAWTAWTTATPFARAAIKLVSSSRDWKPVATTILRANLVLGLGVMLGMWLVAPLAASAFREPTLTFYLRLFSIDVLLFSLVQAHVQVLVGLGRFNQRAFSSAVLWTARVVLVVSLVQMGFSVTGAILASIAATLTQLGVCRYLIRLPFWSGPSTPIAQLWTYGAPLFLSAICLRLFSRIDLFALKALGGSAAAAGWYGAAQNLSVVPGMFALSVSPLLLSTIERLSKQGRHLEARTTGSTALRVTLAMFPFAAMTAGAAPDIVGFIFGAGFVAAASPLSLLIFGVVALAVMSVSAVVLIAAGRPWWTIAVAGPMLLLVCASHAVLIPRLGMVGAALGTATIAVAGAAVSLALAIRVNAALPSAGSLCRTLLLSLLAYFAGTMLPAHGLLWVKLLSIIICIPLGYALLGELSPAEQVALRGKACLAFRL
jgi:O-antigen/teichoic acid export membrane protein